MQLEEYCDFLAPNDIRIKGTRVGKKLRVSGVYFIRRQAAVNSVLGNRATFL